MSVSGYANSILYVNLTTGAVQRESLNPELIETYLGGYGINNKLIYDLMPGGIDPLSPENLIIIGAGPFAGTLVPGASKLLVTTKFPINGAFATAAGGGSFALMLKSAGYDHVVISGRSEKPVFLRIARDNVEICDAKELWGRDNYDTIDSLRSIYEPCSVIPIGPAGENLVKISLTSIDKAGTLGRGGLAAVMGSKNLKAIVAQQGSSAINIADRLSFLKLVQHLCQRITSWPNRQFIFENGLILPPPEFMDMHHDTRTPLACASCPLSDKEFVELENGPYAGLRTYMPHVTIERFSSTNNTEAYEQSIKYINTLNRYGLDIMNFSNILSTMIHLYREGIVTKQDTGGIELTEHLDTALKLAEMTAYRVGFGAVLAEGITGAARIIGKIPEIYLEHIKGQAIVFDPRLGSLGTMEFEQLTSPRGAHVAAGGSPSYDSGRPLADFARHGERMGIPEAALKRVVGTTSFNPGRFSRYSEDWYSLFNCLSLCNRAHVNRFYHVKTIAELYSSLTGIILTPAEIMKVSERAWTIGKLLNAREGFTRKDDKAPVAWFQPLIQEGKEYHITDYYQTSELNRSDIEALLEDYYDERGYDKKSGLPTKEKLKELGL